MPTRPRLGSSDAQWSPLDAYGGATGAPGRSPGCGRGSRGRLREVVFVLRAEPSHGILARPSRGVEVGRLDLPALFCIIGIFSVTLPRAGRRRRSAAAAGGLLGVSRWHHSTSSAVNSRPQALSITI